jgi:hypothetical protein
MYGRMIADALGTLFFLGVYFLLFDIVDSVHFDFACLMAFLMIKFDKDNEKGNC